MSSANSTSFLFACIANYILVAESFKTCNILEYGAVGDGKTLDTNAIKLAISACDSENNGDGRNTILIPASKTFLSGPFNLTSNSIFTVNGVLKATTDISQWSLMAPLPSYPSPVENTGNMTNRYAPFIGLYQAANVTINGTQGGAIDGQGFIWWERSGRLPGHKKTLKATRPRLLQPMYSTNLVIHGIVLKNSPFWTVHLYACDNILIENITVEAPLYSRNTDCIDPDSSTNVIIRDCTLSGGDDNIAIKSGQDKAGRDFNRSSANITVENVRVLYGDGLSIGSEMSGGVHDIIFRNIKLGDVLHPLRIKTGYGRGGAVYNVLYENITLAKLGEISGTGITIDEFDSNIVPNASHSKPGWPNVHSILYRNIRGGAITAGVFNCIPELPCQNITLENISLSDTLHGFTCNNTANSRAKSVVRPPGCFPQTQPPTSKQEPENKNTQTSSNTYTHSPSRRVTMWWKPDRPSTVADDVSQMKRLFSVTDVIIYCGYAALANGSFGVDPHPEGGWGHISLCAQAVSSAAAAGIGAQIIVEGRVDGHVNSALALGGKAFGESALSVLGHQYPNMTGLNVDWEVGHNRSAHPLPSQDEMDKFTADFATALQPALSLTVCVSQFTSYVSNFSSILSSGVQAVYDMGLYHGISTAEWEGKLEAAIANAGAKGTPDASPLALAVGLSVEPKYAWENTTDSVAARFAAITRSNMQHVALFAWSPRATGMGFGLPEDVLAEWTTQLERFVRG